MKPFQIVSPVLISISHESTIETSLTSKKFRLAKFCKAYAWSHALLFTGETSFFCRFFFNIPEISAQAKIFPNFSAGNCFLFLADFEM